VTVKLKIAEALEGKKIVLLPLSGSGMDIKTTNINRILETYGLKSLAQERNQLLGVHGTRVWLNSLPL
jgi:hypothetical protein